jgi:hypothetical protein
VTTGNRIDGLIVPPLPPRPPIDPQKAEEASKKLLGSGARGMMGDEFQRSCKQVERYLNQLLCHSVFGKDESLLSFLTKVRVQSTTALSFACSTSLVHIHEFVAQILPVTRFHHFRKLYFEIMLMSFMFVG